MKKSLVIRIIAIVFIALILCAGYYIFSTKYLENKKESEIMKNNENDSVEITDNDVEQIQEDFDNVDNNQNCIDETDKNEVIDNSVLKKEENVNDSNKKYIGMLEIPDINLIQSFVNYKSYQGGIPECVNDNICSYAINDAYPDKTKSHVVLYANSGNSVNGFFRNIDKLTAKNYAYVKYNGKIYKYKLNKKYLKEKNGKDLVIKDTESCKELTLVTTSKSNPTKYYLIINFKLVNEK